MADAASVPFHFDMEAVKGLPFDEGAVALFRQLEDHYNRYIQPKPFIFGEGPANEIVLPDGSKAISIPSKKPEQEVVPDTETITPKTIPMRSFVIKEDKGVVTLQGVAMDGKAITDTLKKGYDVMPYGPVVSGHAGRYNLKP